MQLVAEYQNRKQDFLKEIDFVAAGMMTCMFANFFSVYLAAPTLIPKLQVAIRSSSPSHVVSLLPPRILLSPHLLSHSRPLTSESKPEE